MNARLNKYLTLATVSLALFTACGGSSDDGAGQLSEFQVSPEEQNIETALTTCPGIKAGDFVVIGGTPPYTVHSPYFELVTFSATGASAPTHAGTYTVQNRNTSFAIWIEGCFDPAVVTVMDDLRRVTTISVSYTASGAGS
jgi:hypothetical protein